MAAVLSALDQNYPVHEVFVCLDAEVDIDIPSDDRVKVLKVGPGAGGNAGRQAGIQAATGDLIALLDDDDTWLPSKLTAQLALVPAENLSRSNWICTSQLFARFPDHTEVWPQRLLPSGERLSHYIFRKHSPRGGVGFVQASTLLFPRSLALDVTFDVSLRHHQDIDWLNAVDRQIPDLRVFQVAEPLTNYTIADGSVSKRITAAASLGWAKRSITNDRRSLGDFILTSCSHYAVGARSPRQAIGSIIAGFKEGSPGLPAVTYAAANVLRAMR